MALWIGCLFLLLPTLFVAGVISEHYLGLEVFAISKIYNWIIALDQQDGDSSALNWMIRCLLLFGPILAAGINIISIYQQNEELGYMGIAPSIARNWSNWLILSIGTAFFLIFSFYLFIENIG